MGGLAARGSVEAGLDLGARDPPGEVGRRLSASAKCGNGDPGSAERRPDRAVRTERRNVGEADAPRTEAVRRVVRIAEDERGADETGFRVRYRFERVDRVHRE